MIKHAVSIAVVCLFLSGNIYAQGKASTRMVSLKAEAQETVFTYQYAPTGAGPTWCFGSNVMVRTGDRLFVSGQVPVPGVTGINCIRPTLYERTSKGWQLVYTDTGNTREPSPLVALGNGRLLMSNNPNDAGPTEYDGKAHPAILQFDVNKPEIPEKTLIPVWDREIPFHGHSYRCFASDPANHEFFLCWNIAYDRTYWTFYDRGGKWAKQGELVFPVASEYPKPEPLRVCYSSVLLRNRAVYFFGTADIEEPVQQWRDAKFELTKSKWDYVFRRLFYCYTPDITRKRFSKWIEIANLDRTAGSAWALDVHQAENGDIYLLWQETNTDSRLRDRFFPDVKITNTLKCSIIHKGRKVSTFDIAKGGEGMASDESPIWGRFHITPRGRLFVYYSANRSGSVIDRLREIYANSTVSRPVDVPLKHIYASNYFLASPRSGSEPSNAIELFGNCTDTGNELIYARVRIIE